MTLNLSVLNPSPVIGGHPPARAVIGDAGGVRARLLQLRKQYAGDELMLLNITGDCASRLRSCELLTREFGLP